MRIADRLGSSAPLGRVTYGFAKGRGLPPALTPSRVSIGRRAVSSSRERRNGGRGSRMRI